MKKLQSHVGGSRTDNSIDDTPADECDLEMGKLKATYFPMDYFINYKIVYCTVPVPVQYR
jgi:hypothetical protein